MHFVVDDDNDTVESHPENNNHKIPLILVLKTGQFITLIMIYRVE